jgi:hypothetical protein
VKDTHAVFNEHIKRVIVHVFLFKPKNILTFAGIRLPNT